MPIGRKKKSNEEAGKGEEKMNAENSLRKHLQGNRNKQKTLTLANFNSCFFKLNN